MKNIIKKLSMASVAGALFAPVVQVQATTVVTFVGGNATISLIQSAVTNTVLQGGSTFNVNSTNANIFTYTGFLASNGDSVQLNFNLTGGAGGILDLYNQTQVVIYDNSLAYPTAAVSITGPLTVGLTSAQLSNLVETNSLVAPVVFVKSPVVPNSISGISNLSSRQASFLEHYSGIQGHNTLTTSALGGSSTSDALYFVGRNTLSAVRNVIDANIYFDTLLPSASVINWTTNASGVPIEYPSVGGAGSGAEVVNILNVISNSIGTVSIGNVGSLTTLSYEGVPFSVANVENGSYPLWNYERYLYGATGNSASIPVPTGDSLTSIQNLVNTLQSGSFETSSVFTNKYVPLQALQTTGVYRDEDDDGDIINLPL